MKKISILGSTGSIGVSALEVIEAHSDKFRVESLAVHSNIDDLYSQIKKFNPNKVSIFSQNAYKEFILRYGKNISCEVLRGMDGLCELSGGDNDIVLTSVVGSVGLAPTIEAIKKGKRVALANKETLVLGGELINKLLNENPTSKIIPVDSEHSAIFQCLAGSSKSSVDKILITASGGPFVDLDVSQFKYVTPEMAVKHPKWDMGKKISVDSATMMNKGLEIIEAYHLFGIDYPKIIPVIHRQSIVHSMVSFRDGNIIAQLSITDMRLPIVFSFTYPERIDTDLKLDLLSIEKLTFEKPDFEKFRCLKLAIEAGESSGAYPGVLSAANEIAVEAFLSGKIGFDKISNIIEETVESYSQNFDIMTIEGLIEIDKWARVKAKNLI